MRRRWIVPTVLIAVGIAGAGAIGASMLTVLSTTGTEPEAAPKPVAAAVEAPTVEAERGEAPVGIAALADADWVSRVAETTGIPERALHAYAGAALQIDIDFPGCGLGWNTLAGIGEVESHHGTIDGSAIDEYGVARPAIIGVALDGVDTAAIPDTDGGRMDGDTQWDRAVGPMQFIPSTWAVYGRDGNGDGTADPHQIDDAALTAAAYLCSVGGDLTVADNWIAAVGAYNADVTYNNRVAAAADQYAVAVR